jgi:hypothetical protein
MTRGLSRAQVVILGLLNRTERPRLFSSGGILDTSELLEELIARDLLREDSPRKQQMYTVVRACRSLVRRGLIEGQYVPDMNNPGRRTISWRAIETEND